MPVKGRIAATRGEGVVADARRMRGSATMSARSAGRRTEGWNMTSLLSMTSAAHPRVQGQKSTCSRSRDSTSAKPASERRSISRDACFEWEVADQERADIGREPCSGCAFLERIFDEQVGSREGRGVG